MPQAVSFSTAGLPTAQRIALWEQHNAHALIGLRCSMLGGSALDATELNLQLSRMHLARVRGNAHVVERPAPLIRRHPSDSIAVYFTLVGEAFFDHSGGRLTLRPGQALICDADRPFRRGFSGGLEELAIKIPRAIFHDLTGHPDLPSPIVRDFTGFPGAGPATRTLAHLTSRALRPAGPWPPAGTSADLTSPAPRPAGPRPNADAQTAADARSASGAWTAGGTPDGFTEGLVDEDAALDLLAAILGAHPSTEIPLHLANARTFIEDHLTDPGLSATRVAAAIGISERHLSRAFAEAGPTFPRYVLTRRLDRAHTLLTRSPHTPVAEVALRCGFGTPSRFSQAFHSRFGLRPTDVRREARTARR